MDPQFLNHHSRILLDAYRHWTGEELIPRSNQTADAQKLWEAPFVVVSSNNDLDPLLNYGNSTALKLWEMSWEELVRTPGRHTAEAPERATRQRFLDEVKRNGFIRNYEGVRISKHGKRFWIRATVWNLLDEQGKFYGQAATFAEWKYLP